MKKSVVSSFDVDHRTLREGLYLRSTYTINDSLAVLSWDLRFCAPMDKQPLSSGVVHTIEHLMAYHLRLDETIGASIVSFCPMGCQTGFYLLVRNADNGETLEVVKSVLAKIIAHEGRVPGATRVECGNYKNLDLESAKTEAIRYLGILSSKENDFKYPEA